MAFISTHLDSELTDYNVEQLNNIGIWTINDFLIQTIQDIHAKTSIKYQTLKHLETIILAKYVINANDLAFELECCIRKCNMFPTGLPELTSALDGGFQTQEIVEFFGETGAGKTELCYLLCGEILSHYDSHNILFITPNHDICYEKIEHYTRIKAGNRIISDDEMFTALSRIEVARPLKLDDLVHLLTSVVQCDRNNLVRCIVIDSLSFLIQEDTLEISLGENTDLYTTLGTSNATKKLEMVKDSYKSSYVNELMRLLTNVAYVKNVIVLVTNSNMSMTNCKAWTNAIDHRINIERVSTGYRATITKTVHNITKLGHSIYFTINDDGINAIRRQIQES